METIRLLYPDWLVIGAFGFLVLVALIVCCFIFVSVKIVEYINAALYDNEVTIFYVKNLDGDNIINVDEIEQITQRYNNIEKQYEIVYYLKSGHELKETFNDDEGSSCHERFEDIYTILNDLHC